MITHTSNMFTWGNRSLAELNRELVGLDDIGVAGGCVKVTMFSFCYQI